MANASIGETRGSKAAKPAPRKMSRNAARSRAMRQQIFGAMARAILNGRGANMTLDEIAAEVGRTKGTIYYHFKSKGEMLYHMTRYVWEMVGEQVSPVLNDKSIRPRERLQKSIYIHMLVACHNWELVRAILLTDVSLRGLPPKLYASIKSSRLARDASWAELIGEVALAEGIDLPSPEVATRMLFSTINGVFLWYRQGSGLTPEQMSAYVARYIMDGLFSGDPHKRAQTANPTG